MEEIIKERKEKRDERIAQSMIRLERRMGGIRANIAAAYDARTIFLERFGDGWLGRYVVRPGGKSIDEMAHRIYEYRKIYYTLLGASNPELMAKMDAEKWKARMVA